MSGHEKVFAVTMMKDEADVAGYVIEHLAEEGLDGIIVADNMSTDDTKQALEWGRLACERNGVELIVVDDPEVGYYQSEKMTALARRAHEGFGASWIIPFDADELWYSRMDRVGVYLRSLGPQFKVAGATLYNHFCTSIDPDDDPIPFLRMEWRHPDPGALPKVAFRWQDDARILQGNHAVQFGGEDPEPWEVLNVLELRHFPYRSFEHFLRKAINGKRAYEATNLGKDQGAHWRQYGEILERHGESALREVYDQWFHFLAPVNAGLLHDPAPYCRWSRSTPATDSDSSTI